MTRAQVCKVAECEFLFTSKEIVYQLNFKHILMFKISLRRCQPYKLTRKLHSEIIKLRNLM